MKTHINRFRHSIAFRITWVFLALLILSSIGVIFTLRHYVRSDLDELTRINLVGAKGRLESELLDLRNEMTMFTELSTRSAFTHGGEEDPGKALFVINLVEKTRDRGIDLNSYISGGKNVPVSGILDRAFAGISTNDFAIFGEGPGRLHLIAATPAGYVGDERLVSTASYSLGREFLREKQANLGVDIALVLKGEFIAYSSHCRECQECLGKIIHDPEQWANLEEGKSIYFSVDCKPSNHAAIAFPIKTFDGKTVAIMLARSRADEQKALYHATLGVTGGTLAFSIAMGAAFFLLTSRAFRPLTELTRITGGILEGRYGETVPLKGEGEVADLAQVFNRMSVSLKVAMEEISEWNRSLERRVEDKTEELEQFHRRMVEVEKLAAMGQLAAGVAHELNNPLSGIMGYSEIALELFRNKPPHRVTPQEIDKMISYFSQIAALSERCRVIILDMLKFARQHTEEFKDLNLSEVVRETMDFLEKQLTATGLKVVVDLHEDLPPIRGNPLQLQQVFTNLILNAIQAMPGGGTLEIRTRRNGNVLEAEVVDHGTGIDPEHLHRIFEPFFTTKPVGKGTGLGLSVSYGIVRHHGGEIRASSDPGKGATFLVILPLPAQA